jgi:hypothetical protein
MKSGVVLGEMETVVGKSDWTSQSQPPFHSFSSPSAGLQRIPENPSPWAHRERRTNYQAEGNLFLRENQTSVPIVEPEPVTSNTNLVFDFTPEKANRVIISK